VYVYIESGFTRARQARRAVETSKTVQDRCTHYRYCLLVVSTPSGILRDTLRYIQITLPSHSSIASWVRVSPIGLRVNPIGLRVSPIGLRVYPIGLRVNPIGLRVNPIGLRVNLIGLRVNPIGLRVNPIGLRVNPIGTG